jgi:hypothetical protein
MEIKTEAYKNELKELTEKMHKAELFAEKIPLFAKHILEQKITGEEYHIKMAESYKNMRFHWSLYRSFYDSKDRKMTNYTGNFVGNLFHVYINTLIIYGLHDDFGLHEKLESANVFYCDRLNTTFYIEDQHIEKFLDTLVEWYNEALTKIEPLLKEQEKQRLLKRLAEIN